MSNRGYLTFSELLNELHGLVGDQVVVELGAVGRPMAFEARGRLVHLVDLQVDWGVALDRPNVVAFGLEESATWFAVREAEIVASDVLTVDNLGAGRSSRLVHVVLRGGFELTVGADPLFDPQSSAGLRRGEGS